MWRFSLPQWRYSFTIAVALLFGWVFKLFGDWKFGRSAGPAIALVGFWFWSILSAIFAKDQQLAWTSIETTTKIVLPFFVGLTLIQNKGHLRQLCWVIMLAQGYVAFEMNMSYFHGYNRILLNKYGGIDNNGMALTMVTAMGLAFFAGMYETAWWKKGLAFAVCVLCGHAVMLSFSRGGMLAMIASGLAAFVIMPKRPKHVLVFALALAIGFRLAGEQVTERFRTIFADETQRDSSAESRLQLWTACWDAMLKSPIVGLGPDHWRRNAARYGFPEGKAAHSLWMQAGAETGFPGFFLIIAFYVLSMTRLLPLIRRRRDDIDPWLVSSASMVVCSLFGFVIAATFLSLLHVEIAYYVALLGAGTLKVYSRSTNLADIPDSWEPADWSPDDLAAYPQHAGFSG
jgi:probable O-glycosylation ligase (exosortase A-associated)